MRETVKGLIPKRMLWRMRLRRWHIARPLEAPVLKKLYGSGRTCVDVGAAQGVYTIHMLSFAEAVWSFEPRPDAAAALVAAIGDDSRAHVEAVALSDHAGHSRFRISHHNPGLSTMEPENSLTCSDIEEIQVHTRTLDSYRLKNVALMKVDAEGHEEAVLRGAEATLDAFRPALIVALEDRHNLGITTRVPRYLARFGYERFVVNGSELVALNDRPAPSWKTVFLAKTR